MEAIASGWKHKTNRPISPSNEARLDRRGSVADQLL